MNEQEFSIGFKASIPRLQRQDFLISSVYKFNFCLTI